MQLAAIFDDWTGHFSGGHGIADDLRCAAVEAQEYDYTRAAYIAEAVRRGYNEATAARCWAFVKA